MDLGLPELIALTYKLGCCRDVVEVEHTKAFELALTAQAAHANPEMAAHMQVLGDNLIAQGGKCLPTNLKAMARHWTRYSAAAQFDCLRQLSSNLHSYEWYKRRHRRYEVGRPQVYQDSLPKLFGGWRTGPVKPSCMGMAAMLAGFASRTGAKYWIALVARPAFYEIYSRDYTLRASVLSYFEHTLPSFAHRNGLSHMRSELAESRQGCDEAVGRSFHLALVIQLSDASWALVDPFMSTVKKTDGTQPRLDEASRWLESQSPESVANVASTILIEPQDRWDRQYWAMTSFTERLLKRLRQRPYDAASLTRAAAAIKRASRADGSLHFLQEPLRQFSKKQLAEKVFGPSTAGRALDWERLDRDTAFAQYSVGRLLYFVFRQWCNQVSYEQDSLALALPHQSLELQWPAIAIATGVLNNTRCYYDADHYAVGGQLVLFSDSQAMWHDSHIMALREGIQLPAVVARLRLREEALRNTPLNLLHPLVAQLLAALRQEGVVLSA